MPSATDSAMRTSKPRVSMARASRVKKGLSSSTSSSVLSAGRLMSVMTVLLFTLLYESRAPLDTALCGAQIHHASGPVQLDNRAMFGQWAVGQRNCGARTLKQGLGDKKP